MYAGYHDAKNNVKMAQERLLSREKEASIKKLNGEFDATNLLKDFGDQSEEMRRAALRQLISDAHSRRRRVPQGKLVAVAIVTGLNFRSLVLCF